MSFAPLALIWMADPRAFATAHGQPACVELGQVEKRQDVMYIAEFYSYTQVSI